MRERLVQFLLDRALPDSCPYEEYFSAGPSAVTKRPPERAQRAALRADLRRRRASLLA